MNAAATNVNWAGAAGNATLAFCGHWIGRGFVYAFRRPLSSGMILTLTLGIGFGVVNAMYMQTARHPAPLFMDTASIAQPVVPEEVAAPEPVYQTIPTPLMRPVELAVTDSVTAAPRPVTIPANVGNKDVAELQARLTELGFFGGTIDGYYGPQTADAIRRFETEAGLKPVGAVSAEVLTAAKAFVRKTVPQPTTQVATIPAIVETPAVPAPVPEDDPIGRIAASAVKTEQAASQAAAAPAPKPAVETAVAKPAALDPELVRMVQTGLSRLGFLHGEISGRFDAETARAIREFENYNNFRVTGELTADLVDVLMAAGAFN